jgi:hypothetical protein
VRVGVCVCWCACVCVCVFLANKAPNPDQMSVHSTAARRLRGEYNGRGEGLTTLLHVLPRIEICGVIPPLIPICVHYPKVCYLMTLSNGKVIQRR